MHLQKSTECQYLKAILALPGAFVRRAFSWVQAQSVLPSASCSVCVCVPLIGIWRLSAESVAGQPCHSDLDSMTVWRETNHWDRSSPAKTDAASKLHWTIPEICKFSSSTHRYILAIRARTLNKLIIHRVRTTLRHCWQPCPLTYTYTETCSQVDYQ